MTHKIQLSGISVVAAGAFNPAIFHPWWFAEKALMPANAIENAVENESVAMRQLATFTADWLAVQVTLEQAAFSTVEEGREFDLRDVAKGVFDLLPETPVDALGINADAHFRVGSEDDWHAIGDRILPKDVWQPVFEGDEWLRRSGGTAIGLRTVTVKAAPKDRAGWVRAEVAPSARLTPNGVYVGVNAHFQLTISDKERGNGYKAARVVEEHWESSRTTERDMIERILELA
jgi:hypothetical protein